MGRLEETLEILVREVRVLHSEQVVHPQFAGQAV